MTAILEGHDVQVGIDQWCKHNTRYRGCTIVIRGYSVHLRDVLIWRISEDTLDVVQYGENVSAFIAMIGDVAGIELRGVDGRKDWLRIWIG